MSPVNDLLMRFYNALPESAQGGVDVSDIYVRRAEDDAHDPIENMRYCIAWAPSAQAYLFSGLRGAGKTTELNRLITELKKDGVEAFYCDASAYLNVNDPRVTLTELLMTALAGFADSVRRIHGKDFLNDSIWDRTKRLLKSDVTLKPTMKTEAGGTEIEIEASLQENPDFKKELIKFSLSSSGFFSEARAFSEVVVNAVKRKTGASKVVLIVDSLERLSAPTGEESALFDSLKEMFFNDPARLQFPSLSVIYTAPPYLHAVLPAVGGGFAESFSLPNFKVMQRPIKGETICNPNKPGIRQMRDIVSRRFPDWRQVMLPDVIDELAWMSGGNVRRYFYLIKTTLRKAALGKTPLPMDTVDAKPIQQSLSDAARDLQWLNFQDRRWLKLFMEDSRNPSEHIENLVVDLPSIIRLFDHSLVLNYQNGESWYQVPPLVRNHVEP